jgi:hypothetical protein
MEKCWFIFIGMLLVLCIVCAGALVFCLIKALGVWLLLAPVVAIVFYYIGKWADSWMGRIV